MHFHCPYSTLLAFVSVTNGLHVAKFCGHFLGFILLYLFAAFNRCGTPRFLEQLSEHHSCSFPPFSHLPLFPTPPPLCLEMAISTFPLYHFFFPEGFHDCCCFKYQLYLQFLPPSGYTNSCLLFHVHIPSHMHLKFSLNKIKFVITQCFYFSHL